MLTKTQKKELKKEKRARATSLNASRRKAEDDDFEDAIAEAQSAPAPLAPLPPMPPVREVRVASPGHGETASDVSGDRLGTARDWHDIE